MYSLMKLATNPTAAKALQSGRFWRWFSAGATVAILIFGSIWIRKHWSSLIDVFELQPLYLAGMALVTVLLILVMSWMNQRAVIHLGAQLVFSRCVALTISGSLINVVLPFTAGVPFRAAYLKKCANMSLAHFTSVLAGITLISIIVTTIVGLVVVPSAASMGQSTSRVIVGILAVMLVIAIAVAITPVRRSQDKAASRWMAAIHKSHHGWDEIRRSRLLLLQIAIACLLQTGLLAGRLALAYQAVGHGCALHVALLLAVLASLSTVVSITPAGLGVRETVLAVGEAASGGDPAIGLLAALADRVVSTVVILTLGPIGFSIVLSDLAKSERELRK
jgi:uncharacterized protein (TIRG00374 family)